MVDSDDLIDRLHADARTQLQLALLAETAPVAAMHLELAKLNEERAHAVAEIVHTAELSEVIFASDRRRRN